MFRGLPDMRKRSMSRVTRTLVMSIYLLDSRQRDEWRIGFNLEEREGKKGGELGWPEHHKLELGPRKRKQADINTTTYRQ